jgi:oligopeptidase A
MLIPFSPPPPQEWLDALRRLLARQRETVDAIATGSATTYAEILGRIDDLDEELARFFTPLSHLSSVDDSAAIREAYEACLPELSAFTSDRYQNRNLFEKVEALRSDHPQQRQAIAHAVRDFVLAGARLEPDDQARLKAIDQELSRLSNAFSKNLLDATNAYTLTLDRPEDVAGIPQPDLDAARIRSDRGTHYRFTLHAPSYLAYMTYGPNRRHREALYRAYTTRASQNGDVIDRILALRNEKARLLGFEHYAQLAFQTRDAQSPREVGAFLEALVEAALPQARTELDTLKAFAYEEDGIDDLAAYDVAYYSQKLKQKTFDLDEAALQGYFERSRVVDGLLAIVSELFGIGFTAVDVPVWHPDVQVYDLTENGRRIGRIYFDLSTRESKRGGAWMHDWESRFVDTEGREHLPSAFVVANFAAASASTPSLLRHDDVVTLFHEMGHALHHLLSRVDVRSLSGINGVAWDVVEFPSQFLENFAYEGAFIKRFGFHYQTGEPIPDEWIANIRAAKNFQAALGILRQVEFGLFDLYLHQRLYQGEQVHALLQEVRRKTSLLPPPEYNRFEHGFSHIFSGGYAAGYYSYKWAEVLSADAFFACLDARSGFDPDKAAGYRRTILGRGATATMRTLYTEWLGHAPRIESLMHLYGIDHA